MTAQPAYPASDLTGRILGAAIEVHQVLGPGLLEHVYQAALAHELALREIAHERELSIPVDYKGIHIEGAYRLDFLVERQVVIEVKAVDGLLPVHQAQLLTYMRLTGCGVGLLVNFNVAKLMQGVKRMVL